MNGEDPQTSMTAWADLPQAVSPFTLSEDAIQVWLIRLQVDEEALAACAARLSSDETACAERFRFKHLRDRYTVTRGAVREILASYSGTTAVQLRFEYGPRGKPALSSGSGIGSLSFNVSHSKDLAILAIAEGHRVGIDIEGLDEGRDLEQIAAQHFHRNESAAIASVAIEQRAKAFYACWTLKEAYTKAIGTGLSTALDSFEVRFPPLGLPGLVSVGSSEGEHTGWQAFSFTLERYAAAVVVEGAGHSLYRSVWDPHSQVGERL